MQKKSGASGPTYPASRGFSRASPFSTYIVVRVSGISRSTTRNTRHANDNVYAKGLAVEKPLLAGYVQQHGTQLFEAGRLCLYGKC